MHVTYKLYTIFGLKRRTKRLIQIATDIVTVAFCFWIAMALRLGGISTEISLNNWFVLVFVLPSTIVAFFSLGLYNAVVRFMAEKAVLYIFAGALTSASIMYLTNVMFNLGIPRSVPGIYLATLVILTGSSRLVMRLLYLSALSTGRNPVAIYGTGNDSIMIMKHLQESTHLQPALFIDDNPELEKTKLAGIPVFNYDDARGFINSTNINLAIIPAKKSEPLLLKQASERLLDLGLEIKVYTGISWASADKTNDSMIRPLEIADLLARDEVAPYPDLMKKTVSGQAVLVTGAGGSIGSELSRQILQLGPKELILLDISEFSLYQISEELHEAAKNLDTVPEIIPLLGSAADEKLMRRILLEHSVHTFIHAAAYKHVPLVESNALQALKNNVEGSRVALKTAGEAGVAFFTLISSDKAVRPTNIMGATKRISEILLKTAAAEHPNTKYSAVRFGNVLASSGSVVPKFEKQISSGGPVTVTHKDITRYFMTIREAAELVIQASAMPDESGSIYILDMGAPVAILDFAKKLCSLKGKSGYLEGEEIPIHNPIEIRITGLRPGEKVHEELLISGQELTTIHPKIILEQNKFNFQDISKKFNELLEITETELLKKYLKSLPLDYHDPQ